MTRVLLAGDDAALMQASELMLSAEGFDAYGTVLGEEAVELALRYPYDIILLDLNLPDMFGYEILRSLRARQVRTPVLIVSGLSPDNEAVWRAFGVQDFLPKPCSKGDLVARIHAVAHGPRHDDNQALVRGGLSVDLIERSATLDGTALDLAGMEYELLELLALRAGETVALQQFACRLYGHRVGAPDLDVIDDLMDRLRAKLDDASPGHAYVESNRDYSGYVLRAPPAARAGGWPEVIDAESGVIHPADFGREGHFMRVLVVEDDEATASSIDLMLQSQKFDVYTTDLGEEAIDLGLLYAYDIILLDLGLPDMSGYEVLRALRARKVRTPVLIVSAMSSENEAVWRAFGAQDFLRKPFHMDDMVARIHAVAGGAGYDRDQALVTGSLSLNLIERKAVLNGIALDLTGKEYELLELLLLSEGESVNRQAFAWRLYGCVLEELDLGVIDVFMGRLCAKLDDASPGHAYVQRSLQDYVLRGPRRGGAGRAAVSGRREELLRRLNIIASKIPDTDLKPPEMDSPPIDEGSPFADLERAWAAHRRLGRQQ